MSIRVPMDERSDQAQIDVDRAQSEFHFRPC